MGRDSSSSIVWIFQRLIVLLDAEKGGFYD